MGLANPPRSALGINIGVVGHEDIPEDDRPRLRTALEHKFNQLQCDYPHSTLSIVTRLAPGAEQLAAQAALNCGLEVIALLPDASFGEQHPLHHSENDSHAVTLLQQCSAVYLAQSNSQTFEQIYTHHLVSCSDMVIALWDGVDLGSDSTENAHSIAKVINLCVQGVISDQGLLLAKPNQTRCEWLLTNRQIHNSLSPPISDSTCIGTWRPIPIAGNQEAARLCANLAKTDQFNLHAKALSHAQKATSKRVMLGDDDLPVDGIDTLIDAYCVADNLAQRYQSHHHNALVWITVLSLLAIAAQQIYVGLYTSLLWFLIHVGAVGIVLIVYRLFFVGTRAKEEQFVEMRVFAEDLRVQIFWHLAGLSDHSANNYRTTKLYEMDWIVDNLNKLMLHIKPPHHHHIDLVKRHWLVDQRNYFYGQRGERGRAYQLLKQAQGYNKLAGASFGAAMLLMIGSAIIVTLDLVLPLSNAALFVVIALAFVLSAVFTTFAEQKGFEELSQRYYRTGYFFQQALIHLDQLEQDSAMSQTEKLAKVQHVIRIIGIEALNENAAWLQLQRLNAYQVQIS